MHNFAYVRATSVAEALQALGDVSRQQSRFLAGGTTLVDLMRLDVMHAERLVDITSIRDLQTFSIPPEAERLFAQRMGATTVEVPTNHVAMVSPPDDVVTLIETAAQAVPVAH